MIPRQILSFPLEGGRFNYRVAAIIIVDGHVLVSREDDDDYAMLPGGRVELGESSAFSIEREIAEELDMMGLVGPLLLTSESFYRRVGEDFHELGFFYSVSLPSDARPNGQEPWLVREDEGHILHNSWVPLAGDALEAINLLPRWLPAALRQLDGSPRHILHDERPRG